MHAHSVALFGLIAHAPTELHWQRNLRIPQDQVADQNTCQRIVSNRVATRCRAHLGALRAWAWRVAQIKGWL